MTSERRHPNVVNQDEVSPREIAKGKHQLKQFRLGDASPSAQLSASVVEIPPGAVGIPFHFHCMNEEAIYILSGTGIARIGDARVPVRAGDWISYPVGPAHAHQMINDSTAPLVYLCMSTDHKCEVVGYPDSNKLGAWGGEWNDPWVKQVVRRAESLDYWDGEPNA